MSSRSSSSAISLESALKRCDPSTADEGIELLRGLDMKKGLNEKGQGPGKNYTPMIYCIWQGNLPACKLLLSMGSDCTTTSNGGGFFPMMAAADIGHLNICKWLYECGGAQNDINKENPIGWTPLAVSLSSTIDPLDTGLSSLQKLNEARSKSQIYQWLLLNGAGQNLSVQAIRKFQQCDRSQQVISWVREKVYSHHNFRLFLLGINRTSVCSRKQKSRSMQILHGYPGIMELIGEYVGFMHYGRHIRLLREFNYLIYRDEVCEKAAKMNRHGCNGILDDYGSTNDNDNDNEDFGKYKMGDTVIDHNTSKAMDPNVPVKNGFTSTYPKYMECTTMITDQGSLSILDEGLDRIREELYQYQHNNKNKNTRKRKSAGNTI